MMVRRMSVVLVSALTMQAAVVGVAAGSGTIEISSGEDFGKFGGVDFSRHDCRFSGVADAMA